MPRFAVRYVAAPGTLCEAVVEAPRRQAVAAALHVREADIVTLRELQAAMPAGEAPRRTGTAKTRRRPAFSVRSFCQELAVLLESGIALFEALQTLREKESSSGTAQVLAALGAELEQGRTFAQALAAQPQVFDPLFIATIEASQGTGHTAQALRRHGDHLAWTGDLRDKLITAAIYPLILVVAGCSVMAFLALFVVPRFAQIYSELSGELPLLSRWLLRWGQLVEAHPLFIAMLAVAVVAGGVWAWRSRVVRSWLTVRLWRLPYVGERIRLLDLAALYRTLGLLLQAGVPMVPALQACDGIVSVSLRTGLTNAAQRVREGGRLSDSLQSEGLTTPVSLRMMRVGEHSGDLGAMLERAAVFYGEELARFTQWIAKVLNPALMLLMGVLIGGVVVLMYLPIFQVAEQIQ